MTSRKFQFVEPIWYPEGRSSGTEQTECLTITVSEEWIRKMYYPHWLKKMILWAMKTELYKEPWADLHWYFSFEHCLEDWIVTHWAQEIK